MDTLSGAEHRWYHSLGYSNQHSMYPEGASFGSVGGSQSSQGYPVESADHLFHGHGDSESGSWPRGGSHNPYHSACHQSTQHHLPSSNSLVDGQGGSPHSTGCSSRLYLPSGCGRSPHLNLHQMVGCPNGSSNWHASYSQHLLSQNAPGNSYGSHGHPGTPSISSEKDTKSLSQRDAYLSAYYSNDEKPPISKLNLQGSVPGVGFSSQIYASNMNSSELGPSSLPYGMLGEMSKMARYRGVAYPVAEQGFGESEFFMLIFVWYQKRLLLKGIVTCVISFRSLVKYINLRD
eukprot:gene14333-5374_t